MGRLADLAKASSLRGAVVFVNQKGESRTFHDEAEAEAALKGVEVEHRRGAFFEVAKKAPAKAGAPAKGAAPADDDGADDEKDGKQAAPAMGDKLKPGAK
jgi:hypothetical protein